MGCMESKQQKMESSGMVMNPTNSTSGGSGSKKVKFAEKYNIGNKLGEGAFAVVKECTLKEKQNGKKAEVYAVKISDKEKMSKEDVESFIMEVDLLRSCDHVNIVNQIDFQQDQSHYYLVMEVCKGGELFDRIVAKAHYNELEARGVVRQLLSALNYLHQRDIVHRDLKPENLLLAEKNSDECIKLADFGFASKVTGNPLTTLCGTPGYVAPEILNRKPYGITVDMWSIGVIIYIILGGYPPFADANQKKLFDKIKRCDYEFHKEYWGHVSKEAKDLIQKLLTVDTKKRLTAAQALEHEWLKESDALLSTYNLDTNLKAFKKFNARRKFRAGIKAVIASNRFNSIMASFRDPNAGNGPAVVISGPSTAAGGGSKPVVSNRI